MAVESAGCPYVKVPVPIQDTYSVAEIAILLRVSRNAVYEWSLLEDDPLPLRRMMGRKRGASRSGTSCSSGASATRRKRNTFPSLQSGRFVGVCPRPKTVLYLWMHNHSGFCLFEKK